MMTLQCGCGCETKAGAPDDVAAPVQYGPRIMGTGIYSWHGQFLSRDRACQALSEMFGCAPSPGALAAAARKTAGFLAPALAALNEAAGAARAEGKDAIDAETRDKHEDWYREAGRLRFARDLRVPFSDNRAEQDIRMSKLRIKISGCMRSTAGAEEFCALRSYLATAARHGTGALDALTAAFQGDPWIPETGRY
jgi:hypothetical protein